MPKKAYTADKREAPLDIGPGDRAREQRADLACSRDTFKAIVEPLGPGYAKWLDIGDRGVSVQIPKHDNETAYAPDKGLGNELDVALWSPLVEAREPGFPTPPDDARSLPFPALPAQLAAFMVAGQGVELREFYGEWEKGPDEEALEVLGARGVIAKEVLRAAYDAYRAAQLAVAPWDRDLLHQSNELRKLSRRHLAEAEQHERVHEVRTEAGEDGVAREVPLEPDERERRRERARLSVASWLEQSSAADAAHAADYALHLHSTQVHTRILQKHDEGELDANLPDPCRPRPGGLRQQP